MLEKLKDLVGNSDELHRSGLGLAAAGAAAAAAAAFSPVSGSGMAPSFQVLHTP